MKRGINQALGVYRLLRGFVCSWLALAFRFVGCHRLGERCAHESCVSLIGGVLLRADVRQINEMLAQLEYEGAHEIVQQIRDAIGQPEAWVLQRDSWSWLTAPDE